MIVWDGDLGKEGEKRLAEVGPLADSVQEFKPLAPAQLRKWISAEAHARDMQILPADLDYLALLGSDLWAIANELEKCAVRPRQRTRDTASHAPSIFEFGDLFMTAPRRALVELPKILLLRQILESREFLSL